MCTISWLVHSDHYEVFFNRDEQKSRHSATAPQLLTHTNNPSLMPIDPEGGGSWIATTAYGQVITLLNLYQAETASSSPNQQSRGLLVRHLASCNGWQAQQQWLKQLDLSKFKPFTLFIFTPSWNEQHQLISLASKQLSWDNNRFSQHIAKRCFFSSSSVATDTVLASRQACYDRLLSQAQHLTQANTEKAVDAPHVLTTTDLLQLHKSHQPTPSAQSICMHREDAQTVSFSHLTVSQHRTLFDYYANSPCQQLKPQRYILDHN